MQRVLRERGVHKPRKVKHDFAFSNLIRCGHCDCALVGGYSTSVDHVLAMAFDDPSMDDDLHRVLSAHEIVLDGDCPDIW